MSLNSVNTNVGAMVALQSLNAINGEMMQVQRRISTGLRVASAKDNPAIWAIAQNQRAESRGLDAVMASLQRGQSIAGVAMAAGESISDMLAEMKSLALSAQDYDPGDPARTAINDNYLALRRRIDVAAANAEFDGVNLISAGGTGRVRALANTSATDTINVDHVDLSTTGSLLSGIRADLLGAVTSTDTDNLANAMKSVNSAVARLGTGSKSLDMHLKFVGKLQDTIDAGIGNLVDADLAKESARLQALQVRQQLAIISLRIANDAPSMLLQLFRR
ncbi:flagellin [Phenylobacterium sp.]|uniref:flagellin n=1 Tax=Phenylobacterium sp. TaxID=1871053 RepID=UPI00286B2DA3|nr:flagellin [Phenylobacterium sp.]